ncbi:MAG: lipopolysaccharide heptosyltransferase II [Candidatus Zixiibacteriota bacterium]
MGLQIIVRTPNHLGDCIMALPMINEVRESHPGSTVTVLTPDYLAELFEHSPAVDAVFKIPAKYVHGLISVVKIKEIIAPHEFDLGYILPPSFGAAAGFKLGGVKERVGYIADGRRLLLSRPLPLPTPLNCQHRAVTYFDLLRRATGLDMEFGLPKILVNEQDMVKGNDVLAANGVPSDKRLAIVAFQAAAESRRWGQSNYEALIRCLLESHDFHVVLVGGEADQRVGDDIISALGSQRVANVAGKSNLRESAAIMSRGSVFVGNDSGPAHLAAAVDIPVVVLSGADDPQETSPLARTKCIIRRAELDCISCVKNKCPLSGDKVMRCMTEISVLEVVAEIEKILLERPV